jgi:hypothetical protein
MIPCLRLDLEAAAISAIEAQTDADGAAAIFVRIYMLWITENIPISHDDRTHDCTHYGYLS